MIAADSARSGVRQHLGIAMNGPDDLGQQTMIAFRADLSALTGPRPRGIYFLTATVAALIWTHADDRWVISRPGPDADDDPQHGGPPHPRRCRAEPGVLATSPWTAAAQYAQGPVFLAGDTAHRFPPAGATGVSAAMHDVHNLVWKIAAVVSGHGGEKLLDSYAAEREPGRDRRNADETGAASTRIFTGGGAPFSGRSVAQLDMGYQYASPVIVGDDSPDYRPARRRLPADRRTRLPSAAPVSEGLRTDDGQCLDHGVRGGDLSQQAHRRDGCLMGGYVGAGTRVLDEQGAVAQVGGLPGGALHRDVAGHAGQQNCADAPGAEDDIQLAGGERANALVGDDDVAVVRGQLGHDLRVLAAVDEGLRLRHHTEQRTVGHQIWVAGPAGDAGVHGGGAARAAMEKHILDTVAITKAEPC
jgi:hypothetical protein